MNYDLHFNPSQFTEFISPSPNNLDFRTIPKPQNAFILYRKNYAAKHKSTGRNKDWKILSKEAGDAWNNESNEVKNYYKRLTKLAREKHKLIYDKKGRGSDNRLPKEYIFIVEQPELLQKIEDNNNNNDHDNPNSSFSTSFFPYFVSSDYNTPSIDYDNIINKTNDLLQSAQFNFITNLNDDDNPLEGFQQYLQTEQTDAQLNETCCNLLGFCHKL
ncbi:8749_t:CDS:2 [Entrophospora sp. SA101]|nr:2094_t:CDS:2 [Entrophospora sp. SA101]CAJ0639547.1 8749_t:CDS:2 [Entrophospora sp. SA101]CAJ0831693.1 12589_t:CDS:2 [Entrophospora sp. SA101]CAJ0895300.1 9340_t:CDS:2 [Entrophospora sp. SA101]CAJ0926349.1 17862_t:CDS:2 [Entrophospora sp. SA101]